MFSTLRNFLNRHKRKFIVTGIVVGGSAIALNYAQRKLREWQQNETRKFLEMTKKKSHFESTERTCNETLLSLAPSLCDAVLNSLDTQQILNQLKVNPENKVELWEELKVLTFARVSSLIYALTFLIVVMKIQLNILCGYLYKDSKRIDEPPFINSEIQQKYLSLSHSFISEGVVKLCKEIESKVRTVVQPISFKKNHSLKDTENLFFTIQTGLWTDNDDPLKKIMSYFMSDNQIEEDGPLKVLLCETMDLLESEEVSSLCISCISRSFGILVDQIADHFISLKNENSKQSYPSTSNGITEKSSLNTFVNVNTIVLPFAKMIPIINELVSLSSPGQGLEGISDVIMKQLLLNDKIKCLSANVYEVFSS